MRLTKSQLIKIAAYSSGWLNNHRFVESGDLGRIYVKYYGNLPDATLTYLALGQEDNEIPKEKLDMLSLCHPLCVVLSSEDLNSQVLKVLESINNIWYEKSKNFKSSHWNSLEIYIVVDMGKETPAGEKIFGTARFDDYVDIEPIMKEYVTNKKAWRQNIDPYDLSDIEVQATGKGRYRDSTHILLSKVNEIAEKAIRKRCFEELDEEQRIQVTKRIQALLKVKSYIEDEIMDEYSLERTSGLVEAIKKLS